MRAPLQHPESRYGTDCWWPWGTLTVVRSAAMTGLVTVLRGQLTARLRIAWTIPVKGIAEIEGSSVGSWRLRTG